MLLKQNDKHLVANKNHLAYSLVKFSDLIQAQGLTNDFNYAQSYIDGLMSQMYPGPPVNLQGFSTEKDFALRASEDILAKIQEHVERMKNVQEWKSSDGDLINQYANNFKGFTTHLTTYIKWHRAILEEKVPQKMFNEQFEMQLGIDVQNRTLAQKK